MMLSIIIWYIVNMMKIMMMIRKKTKEELKWKKKKQNILGYVICVSWFPLGNFFLEILGIVTIF